MSESKHTPGPWRAENTDSGRWVIFAKQGPIDVSPAISFGEPDARLIAAAPDMLKALGRLVNDSMFKDHPEASQMAIDAIAKAEGRS